MKETSIERIHIVWVHLYKPQCMLSHFSHVWLCATPQTAAHQVPRSMGFSRQEYRSGLPFPSPISLINDYKFPYAFFCLYVLFQFQKVHYKKEKGWIWGKEEEETWTGSKDFIFNPHFYCQKNIVSFIHLFNFFICFYCIHARIKSQIHSH